MGRDAARQEVERRLRAVITNSQWATWQSMAGQAAKAASPTAGVEQIASAPAAGSPTSGTKDGTTAAAIDGNAPRSADATNVAIMREEPKAAASVANAGVLQATGEPELTLNFQKAPWEQVLQWIAKEAELSLHTIHFRPARLPTVILIVSIRLPKRLIL